VFGNSGGGSNGSNGANNAASSVVDVANSTDQQWLFATLTALEILGAVAAPALVGFWLQRRRRQGAGAR
jgi:hypothetical protein